MTLLKTITLEVMEDNPEWTICPGHVDLATFNQAFQEEGWQDGDWEEDRIRHEYWAEFKPGSWKKSEQGAPGAVPVTVADW